MSHRTTKTPDVLEQRIVHLLDTPEMTIAMICVRMGCGRSLVYKMAKKHRRRQYRTAGMGEALLNVG
jgi:transposase-like protein